MFDGTILTHKMMLMSVTAGREQLQAICNFSNNIKFRKSYF